MRTGRDQGPNLQQAQKHHLSLRARHRSDKRCGQGLFLVAALASPIGYCALQMKSATRALLEVWTGQATRTSAQNILRSNQITQAKVVFDLSDGCFVPDSEYFIEMFDHSLHVR